MPTELNWGHLIAAVVGSGGVAATLATLAFKFIFEKRITNHQNQMERENRLYIDRLKIYVDVLHFCQTNATAETLDRVNTSKYGAWITLLGSQESTRLFYSLFATPPEKKERRADLLFGLIQSLQRDLIEGVPVTVIPKDL